jgi:hypothetical protein
VTKETDLTAYLFDGRPHRLAGEMLQWLEASPRFTIFVETHRDKIRKKVRVNLTPESALDLRSELEVAYGLLNDRRLAVTYEPYASAKKRGPDFAVTYRTHLVFNIEVARLRVEESGIAESELAQKKERLLRILLYKLGQLQPGMPNLLAIHTRAELAQSIDLAQLMREFKMRVEDKNSSFYQSGQYAGPADFFKDFLRLSGICLWSSAAQVWVNKQARPGLPEAVVRLLSVLPSGAILT